MGAPFLTLAAIVGIGYIAHLLGRWMHRGDGRSAWSCGCDECAAEAEWQNTTRALRNVTGGD